MEPKSSGLVYLTREIMADAIPHAISHFEAIYLEALFLYIKNIAIH